MYFDDFRIDLVAGHDSKLLRHVEARDEAVGLLLHHVPKRHTPTFCNSVQMSCSMTSSCAPSVNCNAEDDEADTVPSQVDSAHKLIVNNRNDSE